MGRGVAVSALAVVGALSLSCGDSTTGPVPIGHPIASDAQGAVANAAATTDRAALEALYHATGGPGWTNSTGWLTDAPLGDWHGVTTDSAGRVVGLHLQSNRLAGEIPAELGGLAGLEQLYLQRNQLSGNIPGELGGLASLQWLLLNDNALTGAVPGELGGLAGLAGLLLHNNSDLAGALPLALSSLSALQLFRYDGTGLCVPADVSFRAWLNTIRTHRGTGVDCAPRAGDRDILETLYHATGGPGWTNSTGWLTDAPLGDWHGVATDSAGGVVRRLDLLDNQLAGEIPAELGGLASLEWLWLAGNQLTGEIPAELGELASLEWLKLAGNQLTGEIPAELGELASLRYLGLFENQLTGEIPAELGGLASLETLALWDNQLTGEIPAELGGLASLEGLWLWGNQLTGEIPAELGGLASLETLSLSVNQLAGEIPAELGGLASLETLGLSFNQLTGEIPAELGGLASLEGLWLSDNQLTGEIPAELGGLTSLRLLSLVGNQLTGEIPAELGGLASLEALALWDNQLTGEIPAELGGLASLKELSLHRNSELSGALPLALSSLSELVWFHYDGTGLCVPADASFRTWLNAIADHRGTGVDCPTLSERDILEAVYRATGGPDWTNSGNWLTDAPLNDWHGVTTDSDGRVVALHLQSNRLEGEIPAELGGLAGLEQLYLQRNQLSGNIPAELGGLASLQWLLLNDNALTGAVPAELGRLAGLAGLLLHNNPELAGALPLALSSLSALQMFRYDGTGLCVPAHAAFRAWLNAIADHRGTGVDCPGGGSNQSPSTEGTIPALTVSAGESARLNASSYFSDPDGEALTYTVSSPNTGVATASVSGDTVTVAGVAEGSATIRITATDPGGLSAMQTFSVTVQSQSTMDLIFRDDFDGRELASDWDVHEDALADVGGGRLQLTSEYSSRGVDREVRLQGDWQVRVKMARGPDALDGHKAGVGWEGVWGTDFIFREFRFEIGPAEYMNGPANYALKVDHGLQFEEQLVPDGYGMSDAVKDGPGEFNDVAISFTGRNIKVAVNGQELVNVEAPETVSKDLREVRMAAWATYRWGRALDETGTGLFDWIELSGTETGGFTAGATTRVVVERSPDHPGKIREACWHEGCPRR